MLTIRSLDFATAVVVAMSKDFEDAVVVLFLPARDRNDRAGDAVGSTVKAEAAEVL